MTGPRIWRFIKLSFWDWMDDNIQRLSASLAYYTLFSLAPLLVVVIAIAGFVFGEQAAQGHILQQIRGLVGAQGAGAVQAIIQNAHRDGSGGMIAVILGSLTLLLGASGVFAELQDALNIIWDVQSRPGRPFADLFRRRFNSFLMVLGTGFLLLVSLTLSAALAAAGKYASDLLPASAQVWQAVDILLSFTVITALFALIYKEVPEVVIAWRDVWIGAAVSAVLFTLGKYLIGLYVGRASFASAYGAAASLVILLAWVYYSAQVVFLGAEFTQVYANEYGSGMEPDRRAVALRHKERTERGMARRKFLKARQRQGRARPEERSEKAA